MSSHILFIFEGAKTEPQILKNLKNIFFSREDTIIVHATYNTVIYSLWDELLKDDSLEVIEILRESYKKDPKKNKKNIKTLDKLDVDTVSQIYLFFDYDGHATNADDDKINNALQFFHDETDKGKLFISYPMVEALKHISEKREFKSEIAVSESEYKDLVSDQTDYEDLRKLSITDWDFISSENLKKANLIIHDAYEESEELLEQEKIFDCQLTKYIEPSNKVAVLSAFPLFLRDYFGKGKLNEIFSQ